MPLTLEDLEEFGEVELAPNSAKKIVLAVWKWKGMTTEKKVVEDSNKQRTISKKK